MEDRDLIINQIRQRLEILYQEVDALQNGDDPGENYYTKQQVNSLLNGKVDVVAGKGLSANDYTNADKAAVGSISEISYNLGILESDVAGLFDPLDETIAQGGEVSATQKVDIGEQRPISMNGNVYYFNENDGTNYIYTSYNDSDYSVSVAKISKSAWTVNFVKYMINNPPIAVGTCDTAKATAAKVVTVPTPWTLKTGAIIAVKFSVNNTASDVTLNVNGSGAKSIWIASSVYTGTAVRFTGAANHYIYYIYDGTYWVWLGYSTTYSTSLSAMTQTEANTGTSTTARSISAEVLNNKITDQVATWETYNNCLADNTALNAVINTETSTVTVKVNRFLKRVVIYASLNTIADITSAVGQLTVGTMSSVPNESSTRPPQSARGIFKSTSGYEINYYKSGSAYIFMRVLDGTIPSGTNLLFTLEYQYF